MVGHVSAGRGSVGTKQVHPGEACWGPRVVGHVSAGKGSVGKKQVHPSLGAAGGLLSMGGHWNMGDNPLGLELTEAAEGGARCLIAEVDTRVGGSEESAHGWSSRRLRCDWTIVHGPCRLAV